jgi:hypothetical protein
MNTILLGFCRSCALPALLLIAACGGGGGGGDGGNPGGGPSAAALQAEIDRLFPYVPNAPIDVTYVCRRSNSQLTYYVDLDANFGFTVFFETDTFQQVFFAGTYTHVNGAIRLVALNNNVLPLDETTTAIVPHLGLVGEFSTPTMQCGAVSHGYNDPAAETYKSYGCPSIRAGAASDETNAFEFSDASSPFAYQFRGGIFRQRNINVYAAANPVITRGYGVFRRVGDTFYADFGSQFGDANLLKGTFASNDTQLRVEQLEPAAGPCNRR